MQQPTPLDPAQSKARDLMVKQAMRFLLDDQTAQHIVTKAQAGEPKAAVVDAVAPLLRNIYEVASASGAKIEMVTLLAAGIEIVAVLAKMLETTGVLTEDQIPAFCADVAKDAVAQHNAKVEGGAQPKPGGGMAGLAQPQGV